MKPTRFLALLVMVGVLAGLFSMVVFGMFGFKKSMSSFAQSFDDFDGEPVSGRTTTLDGDVRSIGIGGSMDVVWKRSSKSSFTVQSSPETLKRIRYKLENGDLEIRMTGLSDIGPVKVEINSPQPGSFSLAGSGDCLLDGLQKGDLTVSIAGSGDVQLRGVLKALKASIAGSGDLKASEVAADVVKVSIAGSGNAHVNAAQTLDVSIAGSGEVFYRGQPQVSKSVVGSGDVHRKD